MIQTILIITQAKEVQARERLFDASFVSLDHFPKCLVNNLFHEMISF